MGIDLSKCIGCAACTLACQAENNIAVVGKDQVLRSREMHWLRVDRYYEGTAEEPRSVSQPLMCVHCEAAPCRVRVPRERHRPLGRGPDEMVYNRCVGTRYCSNNCPYKVRRFNWVDYRGTCRRPSEFLQNPDVTVAARGVMEKCTYCTQRIERTRIDARTHGRKIGPDEVVPACAQACPAEAIVFGNLNDPGVARVAPARRRAPLRPPARARHAPAHRLPREGPEPEPRARMSTAPKTLEDVHVLEGPPVLVGRPGDRALTESLLGRCSPDAQGWLLLLLALGGGVTFWLISLGATFAIGIGAWGNNIPSRGPTTSRTSSGGSGSATAGTLISAILLLFQQKWRTSINRFAEAMTLFAVAMAGMYPIIHLGRPWLFWWLIPYPSTMQIWPNFKSALPWDVFAISTYATVSFLFWYLGLGPRPRDAPRRREGPHPPDRVRDHVVRLARLGAALAALPDRLPAPRRALDAARRLRPHHRQLRLRDLPAAGVAHDHLPALLRGGRDLQRVRDGRDAHDPRAAAPRLPAGRDAASPREHGEGDARDRAHGLLRAT